MENNKLIAIRRLHHALGEVEAAYGKHIDKELLSNISAMRLSLVQSVFKEVIYSTEEVVPVSTILDSNTSSDTKGRKLPTEDNTHPNQRKKYAKVPKEQLAALAGTMVDTEVARKLGCSVGTVFGFRKKNNIPRYTKAVQKPRWTEAQIAMLGTDADISIGALLNRSESSICQKRLRLGIKAFSENWRIVEENAHMVGSFSNSELAELLDVPKKVVDRYFNETRTIEDLMNKGEDSE